MNLSRKDFDSMHYTEELGVAAPELGWVPSPTFILRRSVILEHLKAFPPGTVLEIGCGPGGILYELAKQGYYGIGVEVSERSRSIAAHLLKKLPTIKVQGKVPKGQKEEFDFLFSFEVLEHIENDTAALQEWVEYLKPGGTVIISVPAQQSKWNITDLHAGHYRRYDRPDVVNLVHSAHLELIDLHTCGWPFTWLFERLRLWAKLRQIKKTARTLDPVQIGDPELSKKSGVDRRLETWLYPLYGSLPGRLFFMFASKFQRFFYKTDLGISFIVIAKKPYGHPA